MCLHRFKDKIYIYAKFIAFALIHSEEEKN